jgi:hypothetical protein
LGTSAAPNTGHTVPMITYNSRVKDILNELEVQGLAVRSHEELHNTWFIDGQGHFLGYLATGDELIELERSHSLNLSGIRHLGNPSLTVKCER